jgi:hypothetical protein
MTRPADPRATAGLPLPLVLVVVALFVLMLFETAQAVHDHSALADLRRAQEPTVQQGAKIRSQLQALAGTTAELASAGDENAKTIVEQMKKEGVTLSAPKK